MNRVFKWVVVALIAAATFLNYVDRQTLSLLSHAIQGDLHIDDKGYAWLVTVFLLAYAGGNVVSGLLIDRFGARIAMPAFVAWWSLANALSGLVTDANTMAMTRFALGLAEIGGFVAAPVLVREFFPPKQRAFAVGLYVSSAMFGATLAPPLITWIGVSFTWRAAFVAMGAAGLVWAAAWMLLFAGRTEEAVADDGPARTEENLHAQDIGTWWKALTNRSVWGISIGTMLTYPTWYYYLFWFPKYLTDERGLSTLAMGRRSWIVYLAAGQGSLFGGYISDVMIKRGLLPKTARLWAMLGACLLAPIGSFIALQPGIDVALGLASCVAVFHMIWQINITTLPTDLFRTRDIAKCFANFRTVTALAGMGSTWLIGQLVSLVSYRPMFVVTSCVYPLAMLIVYLCTRGPRPAAATSGT